MKEATCRHSAIMRMAAIAAIAVVTALILPFNVTEAFAADNTMATTSYEVNVDVAQNNSYDFTENININYITPHHGIYRYIPIGGTRISKIKVPGYEFETYTQNGCEVLKIGSGSYTVSGPTQYTVKYNLALYDDENSEKDMLLVNLIPTDWETDIDRAYGTVKLPKDTDLSKVEVYSGTYGTTGNDDNVRIKTDEASRTISFSATNVPAHHGISIALELPQGYWVGAPEFGKISPWMYLLALLGPIGAFLLWFMYGRDDHMVRTLEFYPPEGMSPGEIGYLIDGSADQRDIVSSIVYMADRGYLSIEERDNGAYRFRAITPPAADEPGYVHTMYNGIFNDGNRDEADSHNLGTRFREKYIYAVTQLKSMFSGDRAINRPESRSARMICAIAAVMPAFAYSEWIGSYGGESTTFAIAWAVAHIWLATRLMCSVYDKLRSATKVRTVLKTLGAIWFFTVGLGIMPLMAPVSLSGDDAGASGWVKFAVMTAMLFINTLLCIFFAVIAIAKRSEYTALMGRALGFKDFIRTAELDKIEALVEEDPEYFYHILPYAYVFGLTDKWIKHFENMEIAQPTWYVGRYDYFDGYMMGRMMNSCGASVADNLSVPISTGNGGGFGSGGGWTGGGGFSGGGFSGGGVGGGGGGGW